MLFIDRFAKVADDTILQSSDVSAVVRVGGDKDSWNFIPRVDEVAVKLDPTHPRHLDVRDQASGFEEMRGFEEIGRGRKGLDAVAQRPHEPPHGLAHEAIVFNE